MYAIHAIQTSPRGPAVCLFPSIHPSVNMDRKEEEEEAECLRGEKKAENSSLCLPWPALAQPYIFLSKEGERNDPPCFLRLCREDFFISTTTTIQDDFVAQYVFVCFPPFFRGLLQYVHGSIYNVLLFGETSLSDLHSFPRERWSR